MTSRLKSVHKTIEAGKSADNCLYIRDRKEGFYKVLTLRVKWNYFPKDSFSLGYFKVEYWRGNQE